MKTVAYLDNAATRPLSRRAQLAWVETAEKLRVNPGNPSALHRGGRFARRLLEDARDKVAQLLGAEKAEVIFTSGATESDALAVMGAARGAYRANPACNQIVVSSVEHDAVAEQQSVASQQGFVWKRLPVDHQGVSQIDIAEPDRVAVASMSLVCAETGVIQPVNDLSQGAYLTHTDAAQAVGHLPVNFQSLGVDLLTVGGHKIGAPVGTGVLLAKRSVPMETDRPGGGHERKIRSGTVDVAGAVALAEALDETLTNLESNRAKYWQLRDRLLEGLPPMVTVTSSAEASPAIVHLSLQTSHPEILLMVMDQHQVLTSAGSACHAGVTRPSEILLRMGRSEPQALGVLRVSFGPENTEKDVDQFLLALPQALAAAQRMDKLKN